MKRIVFNHGGGVRVTTPTPEVMAILTCGGAGRLAMGPRDWEIFKLVKDGLDEDVAARWVDALKRGGHTTATAYGLIRDKDVPRDATGVELWGAVPSDRWFRDAWRRRPKGGPIFVDIEPARQIQFGHIVSARHSGLQEAERSLYGGNRAAALKEMDMDFWRERVIAARSVPELRSIWPEELQ